MIPSEQDISDDIQLAWRILACILCFISGFALAYVIWGM